LKFDLLDTNPIFLKKVKNGRGEGKAIPVQAVRVLEGRGSQISRESEHEGFSPAVSTGRLTHHPPQPEPPPTPHPPGKYSWYSFLLQAGLTPEP